MPSGGYGPGTEEDRKALADMLREMIGDEWEGLLPDLLAVYVAARMRGAEPGEAATAAYIEWDV